MTEQELYNAMKDIVSTWWNALSKEQKTAVKLLKFSPSVIGSMFFFDGETGNGFAINDYFDFRNALENYGIGRTDHSCEISWKVYHDNEDTCRRIEKSIANEELIRKLPDSLKNQVVDNLRRQDECWKACWEININTLKRIRRWMFWKAIAELRDSIVKYSEEG